MTIRSLITLALAVALTGCAAAKTAPTSSAERAAVDPLDPARGPVAAPGFSLPSSDGSTIALADAKGYWIILTFFPAPDLPECSCQSTEHTAFLASLTDMPAMILGVTDLDPESLEVRRAKYQTQAYLLTDADHAVVKHYGAWDTTPDAAGRTGRIARVTYLIDPQGRIVHRWVNPDTNTGVDTVRAELTRRAG